MNICTYISEVDSCKVILHISFIPKFVFGIFHPFGSHHSIFWSKSSLMKPFQCKGTLVAI